MLTLCLYSASVHCVPASSTVETITESPTPFDAVDSNVWIKLADSLSESDLMRLGSTTPALRELFKPLNARTRQRGVQLMNQHCGNRKYLEYTKRSSLVFRDTFIENQFGLPHEYELDSLDHETYCLKAIITNIHQIKDNIDSFIIETPLDISTSDYFKHLRQLFAVKKSFESVTISGVSFTLGTLTEGSLFEELSNLDIEHLSIYTELRDIEAFRKFAEKSTVRSLSFINIDDTFAENLHFFKNLESLTIRGGISDNAISFLSKKLTKVNEIVSSAQIAVKFIDQRPLVLKYEINAQDSLLMGLALSKRKLTSLILEQDYNYDRNATRAVLHSLKATLVQFMTTVTSDDAEAFIIIKCLTEGLAACIGRVVGRQLHFENTCH